MIMDISKGKKSLRKTSSSHLTSFGTKYSRVNQVKFVEDSLQKI